jgi:hypothetical protein
MRRVPPRADMSAGVGDRASLACANLQKVMSSRVCTAATLRAAAPPPRGDPGVTGIVVIAGSAASAHDGIPARPAWFIDAPARQ